MPAQLDTTYIRTRPTRLFSRLLSYAFFEGRPLTTRGRWINPLVFAVYAAAKRLPQLRRVQRPVFILGTGRSGTTVLGMVLSMHRDVGFLNEPKALWHALHPGEDLIGSYTRAPARYYLHASDADAQMQTAAHRIYGAYLAATATKRVVDKYPELIFRVPFVRALFPDARFLFLVRNGWDTCASIEQWSKRHGEQTHGENHDWWGVNRRKWQLLVEQVVSAHPLLGPQCETISNLTTQTDMAAVEWIVTMDAGMALTQSYSDDVLLVRYEDLVKTPRWTLTNIAGFCGLRHDEVFLRYGERTLHQTPAHPPFELHPALQTAFRNTMEKLGYAS